MNDDTFRAIKSRIINVLQTGPKTVGELLVEIPQYYGSYGEDIRSVVWELTDQEIIRPSTGWRLELA